MKGEKYEKPVKEAKRKAAGESTLSLQGERVVHCRLVSGETSDSKPKKAKKKGETSAAPVENAAVPLPVIPSAQGASNVAASGSKVAASTSVGPNQQASLALESRAAEQGLSGSLTTNSSQKSTTGDVQHAKERLVVQTTQGASTTSNHPPALLRRSAVVDNSAVVQNKAPASVQKVPPGLSRSSAPAKAAQRPPVVKQPHQPFISLPKTAVTASAVPMPKVALGRTAKASLSAIKATVTKRPAFVAPRRIQISQPPANQTPSLVVQEPSFDWVPGFLKTGHSILGVGNLDSATLKMDQKSELIALRFSVSRLITLLGSHNVTSLLETPERISSILSAVISVSSSKNGVAAVQLVNGRSEHVLEANGEVIGHERASVYGQILHSGSAISLAPQEGISSALRPDWTAHISLAAGTGIDVVDCVRSGNEEDYPKGMAKHFKSKYGQTREMLAARAYILSHVAVSLLPKHSNVLI